MTSITRPENLDWELAISRVADLILAEQSPARLLLVRSHFYDIMIKCIQPSVILRRLAFFLMEKVDESMKLKIIEKAAFHVREIEKK